MGGLVGRLLVLGSLDRDEGGDERAEVGGHGVILGEVVIEPRRRAGGQRA